jgi:hypothetical protein
VICILDNVTNKFYGQSLFWLGAFGFLATISIWFRSSLFGFDSYATLSAVRFGWFDTLGGQPIANLVWGLLPDSVFVFNFLMVCSAILSIVAIFCIVKLFYEERLAWISVFLLVSLSPVILFGFGEFENEVLAYPFLLWGFFYFFKKKYVKGLFLLLFGTSFWFWPFYFSFLEWFWCGFWLLSRSCLLGLLNFWLLIPFLFFIPLLKGKLKCLGCCFFFLVVEC